MLPTIHLNGTSPSSLKAEYLAVFRAVAKAEEALQNATCHPRDFYVQGDDAWLKARAEREEMFSKLREVRDYAERWAEHAADRC